MYNNINRRGFLRSSLLYPFTAGFMNKGVINSLDASKSTFTSNKYNVYFGDIHNHNNVGYAKGSLERSFDIARSHLDFFALTPHSQWHDMPKMEGDRHLNWVNGFKRTKALWNDVQRMTAEYNSPGRFVTFPGYEWHSSFYGDYCIIFPGDNSELKIMNDLKDIREFAREKGAILIPHHPAYLQGRRGMNFDYLDTSVSPVLEIYSEHGDAESDNAPFPYIRHSMGGRWTKNTLQYILASGHRIGVLAGTDDHLGYPGAYGEGLAAVLAEDLSRESVMDALKKRRTYGVTGDRIKLDFRLNGHYMGEEIPFTAEREIYVKAGGWDKIDRMEVLKNNRVIHRDFPADRKISSSCWDKPVLLRIEFGWGPWAALDLARICDWEIGIRVSGGVLNDVYPCFQAGPFSESKRNVIKEKTSSGCLVQSYTSRRDAFAEIPTNAVVLNLSGNSATEISLVFKKPAEMTVVKSLKELAKRNDIFFTGPFPDESFVIHPLVFSGHYDTEFSFVDKDVSDGVNWYYIRAVQANGQLAWSSPIWVEKA